MILVTVIAGLVFLALYLNYRRQVTKWERFYSVTMQARQVVLSTQKDARK